MRCCIKIARIGLTFCCQLFEALRRDMFLSAFAESWYDAGPVRCLSSLLSFAFSF